MKAEQVAIIIPTYGHWDYVQLAIESAVRTPGAHLLIIDDASPSWIGEHRIASWCGRTPYTIQRYATNAGLSRSWNAGLRLARDFGSPFAVCGNSDLVFPSGWWEHLWRALKTFDFAGPVTNAPGHHNIQDVTKYLTDYELSDGPDDIDDTQGKLAKVGPAPLGRSMMNGFCFSGRVESFFRCAHTPDNVFDPGIPMAGNEDDFFERAKTHKATGCIVPKSFVFHYRSVTRGLKGKPIERGNMRLPTCTPCEKGK